MKKEDDVLVTIMFIIGVYDIDRLKLQRWGLSLRLTTSDNPRVDP